MSEPDGRMVHSQVRQMGELLEKARRERDDARIGGTGAGEDGENGD